jgi:hypothetical protein
MVQVDVFWSYGIGAGLGLASAHRAAAKEKLGAALKSPEGFHTLLFLALVFAPSGFVLLWSFPSWETMHVGTHAMPGWLVALFGITNITQGLLGFVLARSLAARGHAYAAYLQWVGGYFGMFFILVHGWDGSGYQRFFSPTRAELDGWTWTTAQGWLTSDVAITLAVMGVVLVPWLVGLTVSWLREGRPTEAPSAFGLAASVLALLILAVPALAISLSLAIRQLGPLAGTAVWAALAYVGVFRKNGLLHRHCASLVGPRGAPPPVESSPRSLIGVAS